MVPKWSDVFQFARKKGRTQEPMRKGPPSALAAAAYVSHSTNTVDVLDELLDKAKTEMVETRHAETNAAHNFTFL